MPAPKSYAIISIYIDDQQLSPADVNGTKAKNLVASCYAYMFNSCTNLNSIIVSFTAWDFTSSSTNATYNWVADVDSSDTRTFTCPSELTKTYGVSNIPTGWTKSNLP